MSCVFVESDDIAQLDTDKFVIDVVHLSELVNNPNDSVVSTTGKQNSDMCTLSSEYKYMSSRDGFVARVSEFRALYGNTVKYLYHWHLTCQHTRHFKLLSHIFVHLGTF